MTVICYSFFSRIVRIGDRYYIQHRKWSHKWPFYHWEYERLLGGKRYALCSESECRRMLNLECN